MLALSFYNNMTLPCRQAGSTRSVIVK